MSFFQKHLPQADADPLDFSPPLLRLQASAPHPMGRKVLLALVILLGCLLLWAMIGRLDIVAVAEGKLVPQSYVKIVQPSEAGIVKEILVKEGEFVAAGQVLMRMDAMMAEADGKSLNAEIARKRLALRRIDAELSGGPLGNEAGDSPNLVAEIGAQLRANRAALNAAIAEESSRLAKAKQDLSAANQVRTKLDEVLPHYQEQEKAFDKMARDGFVGPLMVSDKRRERIEKEQELKTQGHIVESARAGMNQSEKKLLQIESDYRRQLFAERNEVSSALDRLTQEIAKQSHRNELLELRAPQDAVVKDLATHTAGTVVQPGTVVLTLVPREENLRAEVWISNDDVGFVRPGQPVKLKFAAFPFQKYGMVDGIVEHVSADATEAANGNGISGQEFGGRQSATGYKALIALKRMSLELDAQRFQLGAGMQANAEVLLGTRTVAEYLVSPVQKAWHEAGRER